MEFPIERTSTPPPFPFGARLEAEKDQVWQSVLRILEQSVVPMQLSAWILPLEMGGIEAGENVHRVHLLAINDFSSAWVRDHFKTTLETAFAQVLGSPCELVLDIRQGGDQSAPPDLAQILGGDQTPDAHDHDPHEADLRRREKRSAEKNQSAPAPFTPPSVVVTGGRQASDNPLDTRYTFDNFVVGASNQFAHASAVAVAEHPARQYNPLFLYSPPGLGKTHLLYGIGNHMRAKNPNARVAYLSAEKFVNELIESLQHRRMSQFRTKYRDSYDMILIDDIQFIAGKNTSEEEFFHTFNALHSSKRQIVVTSDRPPKEIEGLEQRVRTRFEWGLVADIMPPEIETRIAILKTKAERDDIYLPDDVATFLASCIKTNVRELEGVLIRLQAHASLTGAEISLELAKHDLRNAVPEEGAQFTIESIQNVVAKHFQIKVVELKSPLRARSVALPRQIAMYLIRKYTGTGFKEIGQYFGGKDHTTIIHACEKIEKGFETDPSIREAVEAIQNLL
jgi:chromosomal replication initiator protein